jgi:hypothetical protein
VLRQFTDLNMSKRPGRNDPCPCGSGRKYKNCHLDKDERPVAYETPPDVAARLKAHMREEATRRDRLGNVRPLITAIHQGHRIIAVGSRVYFDKRWRTFTDFLFFYIQDVMDREWWQDQSTKAAGERHPLLAWRAHVVALSKTLPREPVCGESLISSAFWNSPCTGECATRRSGYRCKWRSFQTMT